MEKHVKIKIRRLKMAPEELVHEFRSTHSKSEQERLQGLEKEDKEEHRKRRRQSGIGAATASLAKELLKQFYIMKSTRNTSI